MSKDYEFPWFKFYPSDFMDGFVSETPPSSVGVYIKLLCHQWENGSIPESFDRMFRCIGCTKEEVEQAWRDIKHKFEPHPEEDGRLINPRLREERMKAIERSERAKKAGKASGESRGGNQHAYSWHTEQAVKQNAERDAERTVKQNAEHFPQLNPQRTPQPHARSEQNTETQTTDSSECSDVTEGDNTPTHAQDLDGLDWLLDLWAEQQPHDPTDQEKQAQSKWAPQLLNSHGREEVEEAVKGMNQMYKFSDQGWTLNEVNKNFSEARGANASSEEESENSEPEPAYMRKVN